MTTEREQARWSPRTRAIHEGREIDPSSALSPPIYQTSTFELESARAGADFALATAPREFYTRWGNPTVERAERVIASLEGAEAAMLFGSGMGAITAAMLTDLSSGDHVVVARRIYSGVHQAVIGPFARLGIAHDFADARDLAGLGAAIRENTRWILVETPSNPTLDICDLRGLARLGRERGVRTMVDSTFGTPILQRPIEYGCDVVLHSATKFLGGHSDLTAGVLCSTRDFADRCWAQRKIFGASLSPFEAWLLLRGMKTLEIRVREQSRSALELARFLEQDGEVERVHYPGLESHPQHDLARSQMAGFGGIVSFEVRGGRERAERFAEALEVVRLAVSLGGVESLVQHPASMTHGMLSEDAIRRAGIAPGLLRLSVGLEDVDDLRRDLEAALKRSA